MIRVLEYIPINGLKPHGGPIGYLYNLKNGYESIEQEDISLSFLPEDTNFAKKRSVTKLKALNNFMKAIYHRRYYKKLFKESGDHINKKVDFSNYDIIHFHDVVSMFSVRDSLKEFSGRVCLTSHSPVPFFEETQDRMSKLEKILLGKYKKKIKGIDEWSFLNADHIIFPCEYAMEPYKKHWPEFNKLIKDKSIKYVISGTVQCLAKVEKKEIRKKYGIPDDAFLVSYVGRHTDVKGYSDLKEIGRRILADENTWVIVAGKEEPLSRLENNKWVEVGWTNDPHSIISASDLFVLPNKETYFDLVLLEVISLGTPVLVSWTGGNKFFAGKTKGIDFFSTVDEAVSKINEFRSKSNNEKRQMMVENNDLFKKEFTVETFAKNYINLYKDIFKDDGDIR